MNNLDWKEDARIGVYVCHCGLNIAQTINCREVAMYASNLDNVTVSKDLIYVCSEQGQQQIKDDILENGLNRILVASCSPRLHEPTFQQMLKEAGLNPYLLEMANLREQCSWVHMKEPDAATEKAIDLVKMSVERARLIWPLEEESIPITKRTLIIGGGVAGIQTATDMANAGISVALVEKEPSIGGIMAQLDKTFPTMDCSICILGPKMSDVNRHPLIKLYTMSEVVDVRGYVGNFEVKILKKARYVNENECTACGECSKVCPVTRPDEFNQGLSTRRAIYTPFPSAVPSAYLVNINECLGHNPSVCSKCIDVCEKGCIDFHMSDEEIVEKAGSIIVATGLEAYDPTEMDEYGYTRFENVLTSLEFERLMNAGGPTKGELIRPTDKKRPESVGFIQCVGSRSAGKGSKYCSNICCMNTVKSTFMIKEHYPDIDIKVFYIDIRAFGKGFEDLYMRSKKMGVRYIRGLPGTVKQEDDGSITVAVEETVSGGLEFFHLDMLVLAVGIKPAPTTGKLQKMLGLQLSPDGFFLEAHPKLEPVDAATRGIYFAGCAEGPKDIKESVTQASAAAARAIGLMHKGEITTEPFTAEILTDYCKACGKCAEVCPYNAITVDVKKKTPAVVNRAACSGCGTCAAECPFGAIIMNHFTDVQIASQIDALLEDKPEEKILAFACNWCSYAGADFAGVSRLQYPSNTRLIRVMCSGRVDEKFVWRAFAGKVPVVLISGCHIGDCHYISANHWTEKRVKKMHKKMEKFGIDPKRLQLEWISATEGARFAETMKRMETIRLNVTSEDLNETSSILIQKKYGS